MRLTISRAEQYFSKLNGRTNALIEKCRQAALGLGLQQISLGDLELQILRTILCLHRPKKFIEIGALTGASGVAILSALPNSAQFWTFEKEPIHAGLALPFLQQAAEEKNQKVEILIGDARLRLAEIEGQGPFDGIFIDGNKAAYGDYLAWAEKNVRQGGLIIADNVFLGGAVFETEELAVGKKKFSENQIQVMRSFNLRLSDPTLFESCLLPTEEGLSIAIKLF